MMAPVRNITIIIIRNRLARVDYVETEKKRLITL